MEGNNTFDLLSVQYGDYMGTVYAKISGVCGTDDFEKEFTFNTSFDAESGDGSSIDQAIIIKNSRHLNNITRTYSEGKTPKELIDEQLTAELKVLLNNPALSIAEIATACHFPDSSYLSRFFKKSTGLSPKEFRTQQQL